MMNHLSLRAALSEAKKRAWQSSTHVRRQALTMVLSAAHTGFFWIASSARASARLAMTHLYAAFTTLLYNKARAP